MAYTSWSVVFGEQPSAAKWNILGTNDASFNDGTGIGNNAIATAKIADDAVTDAKLIYGKVRSRQGGSATNWSTSGSTTYDYSATNTFIQCGTRALTGSTTITFPTAFNQVPIVVGTVITAGSLNAFARISAITSTTFTVQLISDSGANASETFNWIAIGE